MYIEVPSAFEGLKNPVWSDHGVLAGTLWQSSLKSGLKRFVLGLGALLQFLRK